MNTKGTIVVGVDGSTASAAALRWAVAEAAATGREVAAVAAWSYLSPLDPDAIGGSAEEVEAAHWKTLDELVDAVKRPDVVIRGELIEGEPAEVLLDAADDAALLVLGSHGHGLELAAVVGSVSAKCLRLARCPVVVLPVRAFDSGSRGSAAAVLAARESASAAREARTSAAGRVSSSHTTGELAERAIKRYLETQRHQAAVESHRGETEGNEK